MLTNNPLPQPSQHSFTGVLFYCIIHSYTGEQPLTNQHPLTDEICNQIQDSIPKLRRDEHGHTFSHDGQRILDGMVEELSEVSNAEMRSAADWQLEQVNAWIDKNVHLYIDPDHLWTCEILYKLQEDLNKAMRPQENNS